MRKASAARRWPQFDAHLAPLLPMPRRHQRPGSASFSRPGAPLAAPPCSPDPPVLCTVLLRAPPPRLPPLPAPAMPPAPVDEQADISAHVCRDQLCEEPFLSCKLAWLRRCCHPACLRACVRRQVPSIREGGRASGPPSQLHPACSACGVYDWLDKLFCHSVSLESSPESYLWWVAVRRGLRFIWIRHALLCGVHDGRWGLEGRVHIAVPIG